MVASRPLRGCLSPKFCSKWLPHARFWFMTFQGSGWVVSCVWTSCYWSWEASDGRGCHTAAATSIKAGVGTGSMLCVHCFIFRKADSPHGQDIVLFQERALRRQHGELESWHAWLASSLRLFFFFSHRLSSVAGGVGENYAMLVELVAILGSVSLWHSHAHKKDLWTAPGPKSSSLGGIFSVGCLCNAGNPMPYAL